MASIVANRGFSFLLVSVLLVFSGLEVIAQSTAKNSASRSLPLAKLCMPVSYRQSPSTESINTKISLLGDRYHEVLEALSGWNESGVPLVGQTDGRWEPVPCGDDTGLFYIVPLIARATGRSVDLSLEGFLFGVIAFSATIGLTGMWLGAPRAWQRVLSLPPVLAGSYLSYKMGDVYFVQASLVLILVPWFIYAMKPVVHSELRFLIVFLGGILLGFGQWIRSQSASAMVIFFIVLLLASSLRRSIKLLLALTLLIGVSLPLVYARSPIHERDRFLALHQYGYQPPPSRHLLWHTAYLGLAYLTNPYVAAWRDTVAVDYVESIDPKAIYGSEEYETFLRLRVQEIAQHDFRFILYTLAAKAGVLACMVLLSANFGLAAAVSRPKPLPVEIAFWLAMAFSAAPGMIAIPVPQYVLGMVTLAFCYWYYSISFYVENGGRRLDLWPFPTSRQQGARYRAPRFAARRRIEKAALASRLINDHLCGGLHESPRP